MDLPRPDKPLPRWLNVITGALIGLGVLFIAGIGFFGSFEGMSSAVRPYFHANAWIVPIGVDTAILVLTAYDLRAMRARVGVSWLRHVLLLLNATTIYFNSTAADSFKGKAFHAVLPLLYIVCVEAIRASLAKWVHRQADDGPMERIPLSMWLTPFSTAGMWYRRHRWQIKTIDELITRERARKLAIMRLKQQAGYKRRGRKWKQHATPEQLWAIQTYALDGDDPVVRRTAAAVTRQTLAPSSTPPALPAHTPSNGAGDARIPAVPSARTPAVTGSQNAAQVHAQDEADVPPGRPTDVTPSKWARTWRNPEMCTAWESYRTLRAQAGGEEPQGTEVHAHSEVQRDRSSVTRWMPLMRARYDAEHAHGPVHTPASTAVATLNGNGTHVHGQDSPADN